MTEQPISDPDPNRPPRPEALVARIRLLASDTDRITFSDHAQERMVERGISDLDVYRILDAGAIKGAIRSGRKSHEWICKVAWRLRGSRDIGVVVVVIREERLWIVTVEWEDR